MAAAAFAVAAISRVGRAIPAGRPRQPPRLAPTIPAAPRRSRSRAAAALTMASSDAADASRARTPPPPARAAAVVYIASSIDGYIAGPGGSLTFLGPFNTPDRVDPATGEKDDLGHAAFAATIDALVMGRGTYDAVAAMDCDWPYGDLRVVVLTSRPLSPPAPAATVGVAAGDPAALLARLAGEGVRRVWVDGGVTVSRFLAAGLVSSMILTTVPVVLGGGVPLFRTAPGGGSLPAGGERWALTACRSLPDGVVQRTYERQGAGEGSGGGDAQQG